MGIGSTQTPVSRRGTHLKAKYGITPEDYEDQLEEQDGECAICGRELTLESILFPAPEGKIKRLVVDHNHHCCEKADPPTKSKRCCLRGLLCTSCNTGLGAFKDDADTLRSAVSYLESNGVWAT